MDPWNQKTTPEGCELILYHSQQQQRAWLLDIWAVSQPLGSDRDSSPQDKGNSRNKYLRFIP